MFGRKPKKIRSTNEIAKDVEKLRSQRKALEKRQRLLMAEAKEREKLQMLKQGKNTRSDGKVLSKVMGALDTWGKSSLALVDESYVNKRKK